MGDRGREADLEENGGGRRRLSFYFLSSGCPWLLAHWAVRQWLDLERWESPSPFRCTSQRPSLRKFLVIRCPYQGHEKDGQGQKSKVCCSVTNEHPARVRHIFTCPHKGIIQSYPSAITLEDVPLILFFFFFNGFKNSFQDLPLNLEENPTPCLARQALGSLPVASPPPTPPSPPQLPPASPRPKLRPHCPLHLPQHVNLFHIWGRSVFSLPGMLLPHEAWLGSTHP